MAAKTVADSGTSRKLKSKGTITGETNWPTKRDRVVSFAVFLAANFGRAERGNKLA
jgi:hypothetical protein